MHILHWICSLTIAAYAKYKTFFPNFLISDSTHLSNHFPLVSCLEKLKKNSMPRRELLNDRASSAETMSLSASQDPRLIRLRLRSSLLSRDIRHIQEVVFESVRSEMLRRKSLLSILITHKLRNIQTYTSLSLHRLHPSQPALVFAIASTNISVAPTAVNSSITVAIFFFSTIELWNYQYVL